jgi:hypothetical protein
MDTVPPGYGGSGGEGDGPGQLPDAPFEAFGRLSRTATQQDRAGDRERRARERFLLRVFRPRLHIGRVIAAGVIATAGVASLVLVLTVLLPRWGRDAKDVESGRSAQLGRGRTTTPVKPPSSDASPIFWGGSVVRFSGGSMLRFLADGRGRIADSGADRARVVLEEGSLYAQVVHRPATSWSVHAGPFVVRVTGTKFRMGWDPGRGSLDVAMIDGTVIVDGPKFSQRLDAGQTLLATAGVGIVRLGPTDPANAAVLADLEGGGAGVVAIAQPGTVTGPAVVADGGGSASVAGGGVASRGLTAAARGRAGARSRAAWRSAASDLPGARGEASWSRRLSIGGFREVLAEAQSIGIDKVVARRGLDDLAALATAARLSDENEIARRALGAQRSRFPGTAAAAEAAFLLGRLAEDVDRNPAAATVWYDRCLEEAPVGDLAAEALGRQLGVMAAGPMARPRPIVRAAARRYLERFPDGPHAARARALLDADATGTTNASANPRGP